MANEHLTNDNGVAAFRAASNHLGGISNNGQSHLVVVRQLTTWSQKEFVVTPTETKYNQAWSCGLEQYYMEQGGPRVYNDTNTLVTNVRNRIETGWKTGPCAMFGIWSRASGPYAWYQYYKHYDPTMPAPTTLTEYGASIVAYKFNLRHLHLSRMTSSYTAYLRVWAPSLVISAPEDAADDGLLFSGGLYHNCSNLRVKMFSQLPTLTWNVADGGDSFEFAGNCNNGIVVQQDTPCPDVMVNYSPFGGQIAYSQDGNSSRVFTRDDNYDTGGLNPRTYYHDFQIANSNNKDLLSKNPGEFWLVAHFHIDNAFSLGDSTDKGLMQRKAVTVFAERAELVLKCTSQRFNI